MKQFEPTVHRRVLWLTVATALCLALLLWGVLSGYLRPDDSRTHFGDYLAGFQLGGLVGIQGILIINIIRNVRALKDETRLKAMYIKEHDERTQLIWAKSGGTVMYVCAIALILAGIVGGYYNPIVFFSLISAGVFLLLVKAGCKIYYSRKL